MTVHYLVAGFGAKPNGGLRIIYEHARGLAARGHDVEVHHFERFACDRLRSIPRHLLAYLQARGIRRPGWIELPDAVKCRYRFLARHPRVAAGDIVVATYWKTHTLIDRRKDQGVAYSYLIQGFENWIADEELLYRQWRDSSVNLVVSKWLQRKVAGIAGQAELVPNAVDFSFFKADDSLERTDASVLFCSLSSANKGTADVVAALNRLHREGAALTLRSFGDVHPSHFGLIPACDHRQMPGQSEIRELYNRSAIYVSASYSEGWGLTLAEATLCGCALLVSDAEGHFEFARPGKSAFFFRRGAVEAIARKLGFLVRRPALQRRLQRNAMTDLAPFTWDRSIDRLEAALGLVSQPERSDLQEETAALGPAADTGEP